MKGFRSKLLFAITTAFIFSLTPVLAIAGAGLLSYGAYLAWHPAAFIVGGVLVLFAAYDSTN